MRCITIIKYGFTHPDFGDDPIFCVKHLEDRAFNNGFRMLNPEFNALPNRIESDEEKLEELLDELDSNEGGSSRFFQQPHGLSLKAMALKAQREGRDR